jgi:geranylgeranyl reductase family protein
MKRDLMEETILSDIAFNYDIAIVGAGPAGCSVAKQLDDKYSVLLLDKNSFPRDKPCGGILVEESQDFIESLNPPAFVFSKPKNPKFNFVDWDNNKEFTIERELLNINRKKFDEWLLTLVPSNVTFLSSTTLLDFSCSNNAVLLKLKQGVNEKTIKAKYLVAADGASSIIRKKFSNKPLRRYLVIQEILKNTKHIEDVYFIFDNSITDFYSWVIPKGDELLVASALIFEKSKELMAKYNSKVAENLKINVKRDFLRIEAAVGARPRGMREIDLGYNNVLLVGEAAGLISSSTGEGISFALRSGENCANAINQNFINSLKNYRKYCAPLLKETEFKIKKAKLLSDKNFRKKLYDSHKIEDKFSMAKFDEAVTSFSKNIIK